jgi:hypothetical protein
METDSIQWLHRSLTQREAPETVAGRILSALPQAGKSTLTLATKISRASQAARIGWSSMSTEFRGVDPMDVQIAKARELALAFLKADLPEAHDIAELYAFIDGFNALIGKGRGGSSFRYNRLNRTDRAGIGLTISRRRYDKLFRLSGRLEDRLKRLQRATKRYALLLVGKAGLVADIKLEDLAGRPWTASFIAYYSARMKLRSEFTISGQQNPFDQLSAALLEGCAGEENANWLAIAHVFPREDVLARLSDVQTGSLMGRWYVVLLHTAAMLQEAYERSSINLDTMIVKKGDDSSTWNTFAGAWNRARDNWIALVSALGMERMFDVMLPGKVMRLMAADVAAWHRSAGGGLHPDTMVWRELPKPWLVLSGKEVCTRGTIEFACSRHGMSSNASGWTAPRARREVAEFRPTPELVHGVSVENPYFAKLLRKVGMFSGKELNLQHISEIVDPADTTA